MGKINTEKEYEVALERIEQIMDAEPGTPDGIELDALADLIVAYEEEHYPLPKIPFVYYVLVADTPENTQLPPHYYAGYFKGGLPVITSDFNKAIRCINKPTADNIHLLHNIQKVFVYCITIKNKDYEPHDRHLHRPRALERERRLANMP